MAVRVSELKALRRQCEYIIVSMHGLLCEMKSYKISINARRKVLR
jgi:hypothetical protein